VTVETERKFDCVYSNKVLHHLTQDELGESLRAQFRVLDDDGILFHTLWYGDEEEEFFGLRTVYYTEESFGELIGEAYELVEAGRYAEMEENDSFYVVLVQRVG
jgi:hypothetical protein